MNDYELLRSAVADLNQISAYLIENANEETADRVVEELFAKFEQIARNPGLGHRRSDLTRRRYYFLAADPYTIVYRLDVESVGIVAVAHGSRDIEKLLRAR